MRACGECGVPMKEKKTVPAPWNEPSKPYGKNGSQLFVSTSVAPRLRSGEAQRKPELLLWDYDWRHGGGRT